MFGKAIHSWNLLTLLVILTFGFTIGARAQESALSQKSAAALEELKPLDPSDPRLSFSFPIQPGGKPFHFKVNLSNTGNVSSVSVFREEDTIPFQTLQACKNADLSNPVNEDWGGYVLSNLLKHADLNFDGFEDLELLDYDIPHLDKKLYCIYLWNDKAGRFNYSSDLTEIAVDLEPKPKDKTLTTREDWQGGAWQESTYRWKGGKLELIEQSRLSGYWGDQGNGKCGFDFSCSMQVKGKMITTLEKPICDVDEMDHLPDCPTAVSPATKASAKKSQY
jgi:hypothetical protein